MGTYVTESGLIIKTLAEIVTEYEAYFKTILGNDIDTDPTGTIGQLIAMLSKRDSDLWLAAQEIYTSRDPSQATGTSLDGISAETGVTRLDATPTTVDSVCHYGDEGVVVPANTKVRKTSATLTFSLDTDVTISETACNDAYLLPNADPTTPTAYAVVLAGVTYSFTTASTSKTDLINGLVGVINAGAFPGTAVLDNAVHTTGVTLRVYDLANAFSITYDSIFDNTKFGTIGSYTCDEDGVNAVATENLNTIINPISGWDYVLNLDAGATGRLVETDAALRIRRALAQGTSKATEEAIRQYILNNVETVATCSIQSNRTNATVGSLPAKSFEVVVDESAVAADVAQAIWESAPAGVEYYGTEYVDITDTQGGTQRIHFSRSVPLYIWVKVLKNAFSEGETYPADGDAQVKQAILDWSETAFELGKDVIPLRLAVPIYSIPGVGDIQISLYSDLNSGATPGPGDYATTDITVSATQIATFAIARMTIGVIP